MEVKCKLEIDSKCLCNLHSQKEVNNSQAGNESMRSVGCKLIGSGTKPGCIRIWTHFAKYSSGSRSGSDMEPIPWFHGSGSSSNRYQRIQIRLRLRSGSGIGYRKLLKNRSFTVLLQFHQLLLLLQSFSSSTSTAATYTSTLDKQTSPPPELLRRWQQPPELLLAVAIGALLLGHLLIHDRSQDAFPEATDKEAMLTCELVFWGFGASVVNLDRRGAVRELLKIMLEE